MRVSNILLSAILNRWRIHFLSIDKCFVLNVFLMLCIIVLKTFPLQIFAKDEAQDVQPGFLYWPQCSRFSNVTYSSSLKYMKIFCCQIQKTSVNTYTNRKPNRKTNTNACVVSTLNYIDTYIEVLLSTVH